MTYTKFMIALEEYYGKYKNDFVLQTVTKFVENTFPESDLPEILKTIIIKHQSKFKTPPDVRELNLILNNIDYKAEQAWIKLLKKSGADDVLITDKIVFNTVATWGSWDNFCIQRDGQYRELAHKDFITKYKLMAQGVDLLEPEVLIGASTLLYGSFTSMGGELGHRKPVIIGDEKLGQKILENNTSQVDSIVSGMLDVKVIK